MPVMNTVPGEMKWITLVRTKLLQWFRISDFTADRIQNLNEIPAQLNNVNTIDFKFINQ